MACAGVVVRWHGDVVVWRDVMAVVAICCVWCGAHAGGVVWCGSVLVMCCDVVIYGAV